MSRPKTATEPQGKRVAPVTFATVAEKEAAQNYAKKRGGLSLAGLFKMLLANDMEAHPNLLPSPDTPTGGQPQ